MNKSTFFTGEPVKVEENIIEHLKISTGGMISPNGIIAPLRLLMPENWRASSFQIDPAPNILHGHFKVGSSEIRKPLIKRTIICGSATALPRENYKTAF